MHTLDQAIEHLVQSLRRDARERWLDRIGGALVGASLLALLAQWLGRCP
jgi:hypothetical protein